METSKGRRPGVQATPEMARLEAKVVLQLACWMTETGQGAKEGIKGGSMLELDLLVDFGLGLVFGSLFH